MLKKLKIFIKEEIWTHDLSTKSNRRTFLIRQARIYILAFKGFFEDRASVKAAALTYFTMLSIVPIFAIAFAIARNFGFEDRMHEVIDSNMQGQEEILKWVTNMVDSLLIKTKGGMLKVSFTKFFPLQVIKCFALFKTIPIFLRLSKFKRPKRLAPIILLAEVTPIPGTLKRSA